jgi:hypothetical protein
LIGVTAATGASTTAAAVAAVSLPPAAESIDVPNYRSSIPPIALKYSSL